MNESQKFLIVYSPAEPQTVIKPVCNPTTNATAFSSYLYAIAMYTALLFNLI